VELNWVDYTAFITFIGMVITVSLIAGRREKTTEDYFLAGRRLTWWLIGFSLIASNISTEHFVGMAGKGFGVGLAIASYEWMAAVTLVIVAWFFLPKFLRCGIYTMPQFLEYRYGSTTRTIMAVFMMGAYVVVALATVLYSGALALNAIFGTDTTLAIWLIGLTAGAYTVYGGLKSVVWSDLLQGAALLLGGLLVTALGLHAVGGLDVFLQNNAAKLHTVLPWDHPELPWLAVFIGGLWIPNLFYWGLNQFITQRTLGAKNLAEGQKGIFLGACLKLLIPFIIVFPGIMAFQLYGATLEIPDQAYPHLITQILPAGLRGLMFAALFGAVMSSIDSMVNSASTIFTIDLYQKYWDRGASPKKLVTVGRIATAGFMIFACLWAPIIASFGSVFDYIQKFWGFITPAIVTVFVIGLIFRKAPTVAANWALLLGIPIYGALLVFLPGVAFLHHMAITFITLAAFMLVVTVFNPRKEPATFPVSDIDMRMAPSAWLWGSLIIIVTAVLYLIFW
jgi:SSS family solute:Na+ symporter